jgi:hypothetical protein
MYWEALPKMVSFQLWRYGSFAISEGKAAHLYAGAISLGRSDLTEVGAGEGGANVSVGQALALVAEGGMNVGVVNAAAFVVDGYNGSPHSLLVAVGKTPSSALAELAAAAEELAAAEAEATDFSEVFL